MVDQKTRCPLPRVLAEEMIAHARDEFPREACGILSGTASLADGGRPTTALRARNVDERPEIRYLVDPKQQLDLLRSVDDKGEEIFGIYHSHTHTRAYPSPTDVLLAGYPDAVYFLVSLLDQANPDLRAYRIVDQQITELDLEISGE